MTHSPALTHTAEPSAPTRRERGEETRIRLIEAAEAAFAEHGFHGIGVAALARACGLGNAGLLHHFPSKARLYAAVLERVAAEADGLLVAALDVAGADPRDRLTAMIEVQARWTADRPAAARLVLRELLDNVDRVGRARHLPLKPYVTRMCDEISAGQAAGLGAPGPAVVPLTLLLGAFAYGLAVRPTFAQMRPEDAVLAEDAGFVAAIAAAARTALFSGGRAHEPDPRRQPAG